MELGAYRRAVLYSTLFALSVAAASAADFRWDFAESTSGRSGDGEVLSPDPAEPTVDGGALDTAAGPIRYVLSADAPVAEGALSFRFALREAVAEGREYGLLDLMEGGNGLRLWIGRNGLFACDLREGWQSRFWWTIPAVQLGVDRWNDITIRWDADKLNIVLNGQAVYKKAQVALPRKWGRGLTLGAFSDGKAPAALKIAALRLADKIEPTETAVNTAPKADNAAPDAVGTFVQPTARHVTPMVGLNIHTRDSDRELPVIAASGAGRIRFHFSWKEAETEKGRLELPPSAFAFMEALRRHRLEPLMILAYGNKHYNAPGTPEGFDELKGQDADFHAGFVRYARYMVETFGARGTGQVREWEIWNEQNGATPEEYMPVLRAAAEAVRAADPAATVVFGGISRMDYAFLRRCLELGAGEWVDAVALHPYREEVSPEAAYQPHRFGGEAVNYADELRRMRELVDRHAPKGKTIPLWITEFGYWTLDAQPSLKPETALSHDVQAKYLLRSLLQNLALGVDRYYIYRAVDSAFFGLTYGPKYLPRPAYFALQHYQERFPPGVELEVLDTPLAVRASEENRKRIDAIFGGFDPHPYLFRRADGTLLLALWNGTRGTDRQIDLPVVDVELPFAVQPGPVGVHDLFLGSDRAWYNARPVVAEARNENGKSVVAGIKFYDAPVLLELRPQ